MGKAFGILQRMWRREELFYLVYSAGNTDVIEIHWKGTCCITVAGLPSGGSPKYRVRLEGEVQFSAWEPSPL